MDKLFLKDEVAVSKYKLEREDKKWKVMIIDDEKDVHTVTYFALSNYVYKGKGLEFISAYTEEEAKKLLSVHPDIAVILLDVVMEKEDSGLKLVEYIRSVLKNRSVRIILRTGHPGQAPEDEVMFSYDINDYKEKTELTDKKFITTITSALSNYSDIITIESYKESLQKSENKYRILIENLPQRIFYKDRDSIYVSCNENYAKDLNINSNEIEGKTDYDFYPNELAEKYKDDDKRIIELGKIEEIEEKYIKDGKELLIQTIKTPIRNVKGNIIGILGVFWDITEKAALQLEIIRSRQLASLGELAAGVAHEVNNPINGIINWAQIQFNKSDDGSEEKEIANWIIKEGNRIAYIVSSLLSFARHSDVNDRRQNVKICEVLSETFILIEAQMFKDGVIIKKEIPHELPEINLDHQKIQQVFLNILTNARYALNQKYPKAHNNKILDIIGEKTMINNFPYITIIFYDRGTGIPSNIRNNVLESFFTIKPKGYGTGLGLSISNSIIKNHGGELIIDSVEGKYTKIIINLPVTSTQQPSNEDTNN